MPIPIGVRPLALPFPFKSPQGSQTRRPGTHNGTGNILCEEGKTMRNTLFCCLRGRATKPRVPRRHTRRGEESHPRLVSPELFSTLSKLVKHTVIGTAAVLTSVCALQEHKQRQHPVRRLLYHREQRLGEGVLISEPCTEPPHDRLQLPGKRMSTSFAGLCSSAD